MALKPAPFFDSELLNLLRKGGLLCCSTTAPFFSKTAAPQRKAGCFLALKQRLSCSKTPAFLAVPQGSTASTPGTSRSPSGCGLSSGQRLVSGKNFSTALTCLTTAFPLPFRCLSAAFHCLSAAFPLPFTVFPLPFHCLSLSFRCLSAASP